MSHFYSEPSSQVVVAASNGIDAYFVTQFKGKKREWECECTTFRALHRNCKHMDIAKEAIKTKKVGGKVISIWIGEAK